MVLPKDSLVKHEPAALITSDFKPNRSQQSTKSPRKAAHTSTHTTDRLSTPPLPPVEPVLATQAILNSILPPRKWSDVGQEWTQSVSNEPATPVDVTGLQEHLDKKLRQQQARETGICPVRGELYSQAFDELIRQVTIICAERGLLLLRVRDELRMTIAAYQDVFESGAAFGMRKTLVAEKRKADMAVQVGNLSADINSLNAEVEALKAKCEAIDAESNAKKAEEKNKYKELQGKVSEEIVMLEKHLEEELAQRNDD